MKSFRTSTLSILALGLLALGCNNSSTTTGTIATVFSGNVTGPDGEAVVGATIYLVSADAINQAPITNQDMRDDTSSDRDEPLEDAVRAFGNTFKRAVTAAGGAFTMGNIADGLYFVYVQPTGSEYLPGGSWCRESVAATGLRGNNSATVVMSSSPSATATYAGMSTCLTCHADKESEAGVAHRLGFTVPNTLSALQTTDEHPELFDGNAFFLAGNVFTDGTPVYISDPDWNRGFDKFITTMTDPTPGGGTLYAILWLWQDNADGKYYITFENKINLADPMSPAKREVKLNYGGGVKKQRSMIAWPGRNGLYPILQYQPDGDDSRFDRTRKQFRDYHFDFFWDNNGTEGLGTDDVIKDPSVSKNINLNCLGCHITGYTQQLDGVTGEVLCDGVEDPSGEYDIDGDGLINDLNIGCETCHGPGSEHVAAATSGRHIVAPAYLTPSREVMLCERCHDRLVGNGPFAHNDIPMDINGNFPAPGLSRQDFLASYVEITGAATKSYWPDDQHGKSHHLQTPGFIKSKHYRNGTTLLTCISCHDPHGGTGYERILLADPDAPSQPLCMPCHEKGIVDTATHTSKVIGVAHGNAVAKCTDCHMTKTAKTGSGTYGHLLGAPTGTNTDPGITYFENDITSHIMDVPRKTNAGVAGVLPGSAMPIPYTKACGTCHDPANLQF